MIALFFALLLGLLTAHPADVGGGPTNTVSAVHSHGHVHTLCDVGGGPTCGG